jgi:hypothetical protein
MEYHEIGFELVHVPLIYSFTYTNDAELQVYVSIDLINLTIMLKTSSVNQLHLDI